MLKHCLKYHYLFYFLNVTDVEVRSSPLLLFYPAVAGDEDAHVATDVVVVDGTS